MSIRDEWSVANVIMIPAGLVVWAPWVGLWVAKHEGIFLAWLLIYLVIVLLMPFIPRKKDGELGVRAWPLFTIIGLLILGSFLSSFI